MSPIYLKLILTAAVVVLYLLVRGLSFNIINRTMRDKILQLERAAVLKRVIHLVLVLLCSMFVLFIWGVEQEDLAVFITSVLTVVGVAFIAQWSLLSNITSSIILFFNHPVRMFDHIYIMEGKDYVIEGQVTNIGLFFVTLKTPDGEEVTLPNNLFIQKNIKKKTAGDAVEFED